MNNAFINEDVKNAFEEAIENVRKNYGLDCEVLQKMQGLKYIKFLTSERNIEEFKSDVGSLTYIVDEEEEKAFVYLNDLKMFEIDLNIIWATRFYYGNHGNIETVEVRIYEG